MNSFLGEWFEVFCNRNVKGYLVIYIFNIENVSICN